MKRLYRLIVNSACSSLSRLVKSRDMRSTAFCSMFEGLEPRILFDLTWHPVGGSTNFFDIANYAVPAGHPKETWDSHLLNLTYGGYFNGSAWGL